MTSDSDGDTKLGAGAKVGGNVTATTSVTLGVDAQVGIDKLVSNLRAFTGPIVLSLSAVVTGDATPGTIISYGMNAKVGSEYQDISSPEGFTNEAKGPVATKKDVLTQKKKN